jgi:enamine deaminase RidA (YjgF/YER057c/UK114 family)
VERRLIASGSPYEPVMGFSRAVRAGPHVYVAGTAPVMPEGEELPPDAYGQTKRCLEIIVAALREAGAGPEHVVRTRIFATSAGVFEEIARAHGAVFGEIRPACTYVVTQLIDPRWHVEIEAEALIDEAPRSPSETR